MPFLISYTPRGDGLAGSLSTRFENLDNCGPYRAIGGEPMFGSGSSSGNRPNTGGGDNACGGDETTGMASGGDNAAGTSMSASQINNCAPSSIKPSATPNSPYGPTPPLLNKVLWIISRSRFRPGKRRAGPRTKPDAELRWR